uniref:hypothetical protein n=1 Tax=Pseudomonas putida TaxID=303 RepID=UPI0015EE5935|nr:hypothetical protein [Pseudomonas putida]
MIVRWWDELSVLAKDCLIAAPFVLLFVGLVIWGCIYFAPQTVTRPVGEVKSLMLHNSSFSTITTLETTDGWYQLEGAVSGARGDIVSIETTGGLQKACIESKDSKACFNFR